MFICQEKNLNCTLIWTLLGMESVDFQPLWAPGTSRLSLRFTLGQVYSFPTNTVKNSTQTYGFKQHKLIFWESWSQKSKARASVGLCFFWKLQKNPIHLVWLLEAPASLGSGPLLCATPALVSVSTSATRSDSLPATQEFVFTVSCKLHKVGTRLSSYFFHLGKNSLFYVLASLGFGSGQLTPLLGPKVSRRPWSSSFSHL